MPRLTSRIARIETTLPPPSPPLDPLDFSRLTPDQRMRLAELSDRYEAVGSEGLTGDELEEIALLIAILEGEQVA
jgi:hypothetical protein